MSSKTQLLPDNCTPQTTPGLPLNPNDPVFDLPDLSTACGNSSRKPTPLFHPGEEGNLGDGIDTLSSADIADLDSMKIDTMQDIQQLLPGKMK